MKIRHCLISCMTLVASGQLYAQSPDPWWFDIEVIVFKRTLDTPPVEKFEEVVDVAQGYTYDLVTHALNPNITGVIKALPMCPLPDEPPSLDDIFANYAQWLANQVVLNDAIDPNRSDEVDGLIDSEFQVIESNSISTDALTTAAQTSTPQAELLQGEDLLGSPVESNIIEVQDPKSMLNNRLQAFIDSADPLLAVSISDRFDCLSENDIERFDETFYLISAEVPERLKIPKRIDGKNWFLPQFPHILPIGEQRLRDFANKIERIRGHQVLHHTVWRQEVVFGKDTAPSMRLVAGENFMASFLASQAHKDNSAEDDLDLSATNPLTTTEPETDFFNQLQQALSDDQMVDINALLASAKPSDEDDIETYNAEWELDGEFKVFLQYINRVPYLHVDSELVFQRLNPIQTENQLPDLQRIPFKQLRRVISKQVHYFDHPLFGLVVQIRRHQRPLLSDSPKFLDPTINLNSN